MNATGIRGPAALALCFFVCTGSTAQDPLSRKDLDHRLDSALYDITAIAAKTFNAGNEEGCCRLFEGALRTAIPLLDHRPELKKRVEDRLAQARTLVSLSDRAFLLRDAVDDIRTTIKGVKSAWERLGGEAGVRSIVRDAMKLAGPDPKVNATRSGRFKPTEADLALQQQRIVEFLSTRLGGPLKYSGKDMKTVHAGLGITSSEYTALEDIIARVMKDHRVAQVDIDGMRRILEALRKDIVEEKSKPVATSAKSLWDRLGGEHVVKVVVHDFVAAAAKDPKVNLSRTGKFKLDAAAVAKLESSLVDFISDKTGGPRKYSGKDIKTAHQGMQITDDEFNALAAHVVETLKRHKAPQKELEELMAILASTKRDIVEKK